MRPEGEDEKEIFVRTLHGAKILQDRVYDEDDPNEERRPPKKAVIVYHPPLEKHRTVMMHVVSKERQRERSPECQRAKELRAEMMIEAPEEHADEKTRDREVVLFSASTNEGKQEHMFLESRNDRTKMSVIRNGNVIRKPCPHRCEERGTEWQDPNCDGMCQGELGHTHPHHICEACNPFLEFR